MSAPRASAWRDARFGELVAHGAFGPRFSGSAYAADGNIATLRTTDLDDHGRISYETMPLARLDEDKFRDHFLMAGDLVITRSGTCGIAAVFEGFSLPVLPGAFLIRFRMNGRAEPRFYRDYFNSSAGRRNILSVARGAVQQNLNITSLASLRIPVPPLSQQQSIVRILAGYDDLIENNRRRIQLLEQAARLLYKEWFVHLRFPGHEHVRIIDGAPEGWERRTIADVCETSGGGTPSTRVPAYWDGDITWVVPSDVRKNDCLVLLGSERKITQEGLRASSARMVPARTILMTSRASVGFFALMDIEACTNQGFINIMPHEDAMRMYLLFNLMHRVAEIRGNAKGTTYPEISKGRFRQMDVSVPPKHLATAFGAIASDIVQQVGCLKRATRQLQAARDILLPRLMSGEIAV